MPTAKFTKAAKQMRCAPGVGLQGRIWASGSPRWIADIVEDVNLYRAEIASEEGLHAAFGFPIQSDSEVLGVMTFFSRDRKQVDEELLQTAAVIGSQLGEFIKRKQAELALQESKANLAEAQTIAHVGSWAFERRHRNHYLVRGNVPHFRFGCETARTRLCRLFTAALSGR